MSERSLLVALALLACAACTEAPSLTQVELSDPIDPSFAVQGETVRLPFWERGPVCCVEDHVLIYFYVTDPSDVPADANLLGFQIDPRAFGADFAVEGFNLRTEPGARFPYKVHLRGVAPVPFWFVPRELFDDASSDGFLGIDELLDEPALIQGHADLFQEEVHPTPPVENTVFSMTARGVLTDGRPFRARITNSNGQFSVDGRLGG